MIEEKEATLGSTLINVIESVHSSESRLVSVTTKINTINPFAFFEAAKKIDGNRSFWMSTLDELTLVGIGEAYTIHEENGDMEGLKDKWDTVLSEAVIHNPYQTPGSGLTAIGGMAFDAKKADTSLWDDFGKNELRIPTFMLVKYKESTYLTVTVLLKGTEQRKQLVNELEDQVNVLLTKQVSIPEKPALIQQEEVEPDKWKETVREATDYIKDGKVEKIVLARELRLTFTEIVPLTAIVRDLIETQPTSYIFAYEKDDKCFVGATPERLVKVENNQLLSTCLAGTAPRGSNTEEDERIGYQLLHDKKNLGEHDFVVQMIKSSVEEFCEDLQVPDKPVLYKLRNLQHLYTPVRGLFKEGYRIFDVIAKLHPTPALGGEPREEALSFIRENEMLDRGWYGAPIGWVDSNQNGEFAVAIRSGLIQGDKTSLFAGCGVVRDSNPEAEFEETRMKFLPMLTVLGG